MKKIIIFGANKHCKIVKDMAEVCGYEVAGFISPDVKGEYLGHPVYSSIDEVESPAVPVNETEDVEDEYEDDLDDEFDDEESLDDLEFDESFEEGDEF